VPTGVAANRVAGPDGHCAEESSWLLLRWQTADTVARTAWARCPCEGAGMGSRERQM